MGLKGLKPIENDEYMDDGVIDIYFFGVCLSYQAQKWEESYIRSYLGSKD